MSHHHKRFPNESNEYRKARDELLTEEIKLRAQIEKIGKMRMALPLGGTIKEDYKFDEFDGSGLIRQVKLSDLFARGKDTLVVYSFMYSLEMESACPSCTSIIDSLDASAPHLMDRVNIVVVAKSPIERFAEHAKTRAWVKLRLLSSENNNYNDDYFAVNDSGKQIPALNVFTQNDNGIFHYFNAELLYVDLKGHPRHVDSIWPIWNLFDMTPEGRGEDWFPSLSYE